MSNIYAYANSRGGFIKITTPHIKPKTLKPCTLCRQGFKANLSDGVVRTSSKRGNPVSDQQLKDVNSNIPMVQDSDGMYVEWRLGFMDL
jgi:hypothetical protein